MNSALLSRSKVHVLKALGLPEISAILRRALEDASAGSATCDLSADDEALTAIAKYANGDARVALNFLETAVTRAGDSRPDRHRAGRRPGARTAPCSTTSPAKSTTT